MTFDFRFPFNGGRLKQVRRTKKDKHGTAKGWPRPLNRGDPLIKVTITTFVWAKIRNFENWPLNTGPLYTGSTVFNVIRESVMNYICFVKEN